MFGCAPVPSPESVAPPPAPDQGLSRVVVGASDSVGQRLREAGTGLSGLIDAWYGDAASTGLTWDLTIAAITLTVWVIAEVAVRRNWLALVAIPATFGIGVSCGLPLYLFLRTRPV